jgi:predicted  nucleic acid-binding Zn-ribbon protein
MGKIKYLYIMDKNLLSEEIIKNAFFKVISEETSKVKREDFSRVQYKIEELQNSLNETMKEMRKLEDCIPDGLKSISNGRISKISTNLQSAQTLINQLKNKIKEHKRAVYSQQIEEKKK